MRGTFVFISIMTKKTQREFLCGFVKDVTRVRPYVSHGMIHIVSSGVRKESSVRVWMLDFPAGSSGKQTRQILPEIP